jgi:hypothetical protein
LSPEKVAPFCGRAKSAAGDFLQSEDNVRFDESAF